MLSEVNLQQKLLKERNKKIPNNNILLWVSQIFNDLDSRREATLQKVKSSQEETSNSFKSNKIDANKIFHIDEIKKICIDYRLRFLDTKFFKGTYPEEVISKIHELEKEHETKLSGFKIIAPSKLFVLKKADDPLLFVTMGNDYYYLIHKWGKDLHPLRKYKVWSLKNVGNLITITLAVSLLLTLLFKDFVFANNASAKYSLVLFLFVFKFAIGFILFYGIATGKNFNEYIWKSQYNKVQ